MCVTSRSPFNKERSKPRTCNQAKKCLKVQVCLVYIGPQDAIFSRLAKCGKANIRHPLKDKHKKKRPAWAQKYMKLPFKYVLFTNECRASLDGPNCWPRGWFSVEHGRPHLRCQQGGSSDIFWVGIVGNELVGPFRVEDGIKMTAIVYIDFLKKNFDPWHKSKNLAFCKKFVFMHDNAPLHAAQLSYLNKVGWQTWKDYGVATIFAGLERNREPLEHT